MTTVRVKTDESIIQKLEGAFTSPSCVISEAMQNARRAGATKVEFHYIDEEAISITDDGHGIESFQSFLTLAGSGWDKAVIYKEGAFGIGSFSMLYSCDHIKVESNGQCLEADTKDILQQKEITITKSNVTTGTRIELYGYKISPVNNASRIERDLIEQAKGFSIPVFYDDRELERPYSLDNTDIDFISTSIGQVHLKGKSLVDKLIMDCKADIQSSLGTANLNLFFQGLPVGNHKDYFGYGNIIHLDETIFSVRVPDRSVLICHNDQELMIDYVVKSLWKEIITNAKESLSPEAFINIFYASLERWDCLSLMNDIDILPSQVTFTVTERPHQERPYADDSFVTGLSITKSELDAKGIKIFQLSSQCTEESIAEWSYAYHGEFICCNIETGLDSKHWINDYLVKIDKENPLSVSVTNPKQSTIIFSGDWCYFICSHGDVVEIDGPLGKVISEHDCVYVSECDEFISEQAGMYIPAKALSGHDIYMANSFTSNDDFDETAAYKEVRLFEAFLLSLNSTKDNAIKLLLTEGRIQLLKLNNQTITITFDEDGNPKSVTEQAA